MLLRDGVCASIACLDGESVLRQSLLNAVTVQVMVVSGVQRSAAVSRR